MSRPSSEKEIRIQNIVKRHDESSFQQEIERGFPKSHIFYVKQIGNESARVFCLLELCVQYEFVFGVEFLLKDPGILRRFSFANACASQNYNMLCLFLRNACELRKNRLEYLHLLLYHHIYNLAEAFIEMPGYDINEVNGVVSSTLLKYERGQIKQSALHLAVVYEQTQIIEKLIARGAKLDILDDQDNTPLYLACVIGSYVACKILLRNGASPFWPDGQANYRSALFACCCQSLKGQDLNLDIVNLLLATGLNVNGERWLSTNPPLTKISQPASRALFKSYRGPSKLEAICIKKVRTHLFTLTHGQAITAKLEALSLPPLLKSILLQKLPGYLRLVLEAD